MVDAKKDSKPESPDFKGVNDKQDTSRAALEAEADKQRYKQDTSREDALAAREAELDRRERTLATRQTAGADLTQEIDHQHDWTNDQSLQHRFTLADGRVITSESLVGTHHSDDSGTVPIVTAFSVR